MKPGKLSWTFTAFLFFAAASFAQQAEKRSCEVPLVVTRFNPSSEQTEMVRNLGVNDLRAELGTVPVAVETVSTDDGPKRVAVILDDSERVPKDEWRLETDLAASFVEHGREGDTFALLLVGSPGAASPFVPAAAIRKRLRELMSSRPAAVDAGGHTFDTLLAAVNLLNPPRFGDAIFLFGHPEDSGSTAGLDQIREAILRNGLRFYGTAFYDPLQGKLPPGFDLNKRLPAAVGPPPLADVNLATGYFFGFHTVKDLSMPAMTVSIRGKVHTVPPQIELAKGFLADLYAGIATPYRVGIPAAAIRSPVGVKIAVADADERQIRSRDVHYPHFVYPCSAPAPVTH